MASGAGVVGVSHGEAAGIAHEAHLTGLGEAASDLTPSAGATTGDSGARDPGSNDTGDSASDSAEPG